MRVEERYRDIPGVRPRNTRAQWVMEKIADGFIDMELDRDVTGWDNIEAWAKYPKCRVAVGKHISHMDPWGYLKPLRDRAKAEEKAGNPEKGKLYADLYMNTVFLIGPRVARLPVVGWLLEAAPGIYIPSPKERPADREEVQKLREDKDRIEKTQRAILEGDRLNLFYYPEGTRSRDGGMNHPARLAERVLMLTDDVVVLPVRVQGTERIHAVGSKMMRRGRITVDFGEPIETSNMKNMKPSERGKFLDEVIMRDGIAYHVDPKFHGVYARKE